MCESGNEFDRILEKHKDNLNTGKELFIECFLGEIELHKYDTPELIISALNTHLEGLRKD